MCAQGRLRSAWASARSDQSSLCAQLVAKDPSFLRADSEDCSDWLDAQADLSLRWAHSHFVGFCHLGAHIHPAGMVLPIASAACNVTVGIGEHVHRCWKLSAFLDGLHQANLVLITYVSSEGSGEPAHPRSLARTSATRSYK